jgi:redox-sensitive bicupin YhaK (pirin superfamily)
VNNDAKGINMDKTTPVRSIKKVWKSIPTLEGAGVRLKRAFGFHEIPQLDPFLLLDCFHSDSPGDYKAGFPWHPHRGMETITYVLDGDVEHKDSLGNGGVIGAGDVQWMTAGSGIIHQEMPKGNRKGEMWGFQLWANLPAQDKMTDPRYREVKENRIPKVTTPDGATVRLIAGSLAGAQGPVADIVTGPEYLDVSLPPGKVFTHPIKAGHTVFAYVVEGEGYFDPGRDPFGPRPCTCREGDVVLYKPGGDTVMITADKKPVRFLLVSGKPLKEPIAWHGPIVMNTQEELRQAFDEFQQGTFIKQKTTDAR